MSATGTSGKSECLAPGVIASPSPKGQPSQIQDRSRTHPGGGGGGGSGSRGQICRCSPASLAGSRTVRRILAACLVSLVTLLGSISLDLSNSLQMWRNTELALRGLSSCRNLQAVHMIGFLQEERRLCCWEHPMNSILATSPLYHHRLQDRLKAFCIHTQDRFPTLGSRCEDREAYGSECQIYAGELEQRLNYTSETKMGFLLSTLISELLDNLQTEEYDLQTAKSNLDWADVSSFRLILKVHEAALQKHYLGRNHLSIIPETPWDQITSILNYAVFSSEILQDCWVENENLSHYTARLEEPYFSMPFTIPLPQTQLRPLISSLGFVQSCLLQRAGEKLILKSREVLSMISLKVSLLAIACLIYPIVLVSFKQMTEWIQNYARSLRERTEDLKQERRLAEDLLHQMLPKYVVKQLRKHKHVEAESYEQVSIFFSDIVGFTSISASCTPLQVVEMLNNLYVCFDTRIDSYNVYKVETIGDAYMVVSGLPERNGIKHADEIAKMSLDLVAAVRQVMVPHMPKQRLQMRVGIHTGPCVAGVVGYKMPRYCLFGDTVNTASRMESTSLPQKIHISSATYDVLMVDGAYEIEPRGETEIKGKGKMKTYWLIGNKNYSIQNDSLVCHWNPAISRQKMLERSMGSTHQSSTSTVAPSLSDRTTPASGEVHYPGHQKQETTEPALGVGEVGSSLTIGQKIDLSHPPARKSSDLHVPHLLQNPNTLTISVSPAAASTDHTATIIQDPGTFGRTVEANTFLPGFVGGTERPS